MARLRLDLDEATYGRLLDLALAEKRPVHWQAERIIERTLARRQRRPDRDPATIGPDRPEPDQAA